MKCVERLEVINKKLVPIRVERVSDEEAFRLVHKYQYGKVRYRYVSKTIWKKFLTEQTLNA